MSATGVRDGKSERAVEVILAHVPVITLSSSFGSGGGPIAQRVAEKLGWDLYNRAIPAEVATLMSLPTEAALTHDEAAESLVGRLLSRFSVQLSTDGAGNVPAEVFLGDVAFKDKNEELILRLAERSNCVIVGRAAAVILRNSPSVLHVRIDGNPERRIHQAAEALGISVDTSRKKLVETDRARRLYVKHFYGRDWSDPALYHITIDGTVFSVDGCARLIFAAAEIRFGAAPARSGPET